MKRDFFAGVFFCVLFLLFCFSPRQAGATACRDFQDLIHNGGYAIADTDGRIIDSCNPDILFIPASIIKIQTALAALHILGSDFRFQTTFYMDDGKNLYIQAAGDPFLTSEEVELILTRLHNKGIGEINGIFVDPSLYNLQEKVPGRGESDNPFDSPVTAAGVNFNTINILVDNQGKVMSAEPQTPTLPLMQEMGKGLVAGTYRLNICQGKCDPEMLSARYTIELFRAFQRRVGIRGDGQQGLHSVPDYSTVVYRHQNSKNLEQIIASFLEYSNNFIANQVFLACGTKKYGYPASWEKARKAVAEALNEIWGGGMESEYSIVDGAGLSRHNRITAAGMIRTLASFMPYQELMKEKKQIKIKSGTLKGVYNYAGYFADGKPFVILLNQKENNRDKILERLKNKSYSHTGK